MLVHTRYGVCCTIVMAQCMHRHVCDITTAIDEKWQSKGRQKGSELYRQGEFLHSYYTFESVNDCDHDDVVRIFVGLSCELWGFFILHYILWRSYIARNNLFTTRSV